MTLLQFCSGLCPRPGRALLVLAATAILATGCAAVTPGHPKAQLSQERPPQAAAPQEAAPSCQVELKTRGGKTQVRKVALTGEQHVGDVLAETGALRKFANCEVSVLRKQPNGAIAKMNVNLAPNKRQVRGETDYFLYPSDRVLVQEADSTAAEEMLGGMMGSMTPRRK